MNEFGCKAVEVENQSFPSPGLATFPFGNVWGPVSVLAATTRIAQSHWGNNMSLFSSMSKEKRVGDSEHHVGGVGPGILKEVPPDLAWWQDSLGKEMSREEIPHVPERKQLEKLSRGVRLEALTHNPEGRGAEYWTQHGLRSVFNVLKDKNSGKT